MTTPRPILIAFVSLALAGASAARSIDGWNWPPSLEKLWQPIVAWSFNLPAEHNSPATTMTFAEHYRFFASHARPEEVVPDIIADLRVYPSESSYLTYLALMQQWQRDRVLRILLPFRYSFDHPLLRSLLPFEPRFDDIATVKIADELYADLARP
jgi:hypothetical protein